ncbi:hypothetical protein Cantr_09259 [Candida viswanathii]|uniref:Protein bir1 n=1 Tax=Candida viswanathii TaxID=5486 RepID=A0A367Y9Y7_9ASCO|nr:hypothetical protein Cantr_09259 [Candida viswanathii]
MSKFNKDMIYRDNRVNTFVDPVKIENNSYIWEDNSDVTDFDVLINSGFYYNPTKKYKTRVTCAYCGHSSYIKSQKDVDTIVYKHKRASPSCPMIMILDMNKTIARAKGDPNQIKNLWKNNERFREPLSTASQEFRKQFFIDYPLDKIDSRPNSTTLAHAGFFHNPRNVEDDRVTCLYCQCSLDFWEMDDDPIEEHQKNEVGYCYFLDMYHNKDGKSDAEVAKELLEDSGIELEQPEEIKESESDSTEDLDIVEISRSTKIESDGKNDAREKERSDDITDSDIVEIEREPSKAEIVEVENEPSKSANEASNIDEDDVLPDFDNDVPDETTNDRIDYSLPSPGTTKSNNLSIIKLPAKAESEPPATYRRSKRIKRLYSERDRNVDYWDKLPDDDLLQEFIDVSQKPSKLRRKNKKVEESTPNDSKDELQKENELQVDIVLDKPDEDVEDVAVEIDIDVGMDNIEDNQDDDDIQKMLDIEDIVETSGEELDVGEKSSEEDATKDNESKVDDPSKVEESSAVEISSIKEKEASKEQKSDSQEAGSENEDEEELDDDEEESSYGESVDSNDDSENESTTIPEPADELYEVTESSDESIDEFDNSRRKPKPKKSKEPSPATKPDLEPKQPRRITITRREKSTTPLPGLFDDSSDNFEYDEQHVEKLESQPVKKSVELLKEETKPKKRLSITKDPALSRKLSLTTDPVPPKQRSVSPVRFLDGLKDPQTKRRKVSKPSIFDTSLESPQKFSSPLRFSSPKTEQGLIQKDEDEEVVGDGDAKEEKLEHPPSNEDKEESDILKEINDNKSDILSPQPDGAIEEDAKDSSTKESNVVDPDVSYDVLIPSDKEDASQEKESDNEIFVDAQPVISEPIQEEVKADQAVERALSTRDAVERLPTPSVDEFQGTSTSNNSRIDLEGAELKSAEEEDGISEEESQDDTNSIEELVSSDIQEEERDDNKDEADEDEHVGAKDASPNKLYLNTLDIDQSQASVEEEDVTEGISSINTKASPARSQESTKDLKRASLEGAEVSVLEEQPADNYSVEDIAVKEEQSVLQKELTNDDPGPLSRDEIESPPPVIKRLSFNGPDTSPLAMNSSLTHIHKPDQEEEEEEEEELTEAAAERKWQPRPLTKFVEQMKFLESSAKELKELANSEYDLNNDVNGDITRFIAEMPEEEENMTIKQWMEHCATNCRDIVTQSCGELGDFILEEYDRAIQEIENLPTID